MIVTSPFEGDISTFKHKALQWATSFDVACCFDSNGYLDQYGSFDYLVAAGSADSVVHIQGTDSWQSISNFIAENPSVIPGFLSYDLKNELEDLQSDNADYTEFPDFFFFKPVHVLIIRGKEVTTISEDVALLEIINSIEPPIPTAFLSESHVRTRYSKQEFTEQVSEIKKAIQRGDIYEVNFCQEFYLENVKTDPLSLYVHLNSVSPTPFSAYFKLNDKYILCASPERYLRKINDTLISQPIKGTAARSADPYRDEQLKKELQLNLKEQTENVMIVDLVRNDLTRISVEGSVTVTELFGIYSFRQVHQLISTVQCKVNTDVDPVSIIKATFPMGSMTGAPKISAMRVIETNERSKRGIYSGAIGYFESNGDFDFNVVIRSIIYNHSTGYLSFHTGGAVTIASDPEKEYEECMLKAKAILQVIEQNKS